MQGKRKDREKLGPSGIRSGAGDCRRRRDRPCQPEMVGDGPADSCGGEMHPAPPTLATSLTAARSVRRRARTSVLCGGGASDHLWAQPLRCSAKGSQSGIVGNLGAIAAESFSRIGVRLCLPLACGTVCVFATTGSQRDNLHRSRPISPQARSSAASRGPSLFAEPAGKTTPSTETSSSEAL